MKFILLLIAFALASATPIKENGLKFDDFCRILKDFHLTKDEHSTKFEKTEIERLNQYCNPGKFDLDSVKQYIKFLHIAGRFRFTLRYVSTLFLRDLSTSNLHLVTLALARSFSCLLPSLMIHFNIQKYSVSNHHLFRFIFILFYFIPF